MTRRIIITGTPGTGKTTIAKLLGKKLDLPVTHITELVKEKKLSVGKEKGSLLVNMKKLKHELERKQGIIEGHLACEFTLKDSTVVVLRCDPKKLKTRMKKRNYPAKKIRENQEAEALDYCTLLAEKNYSKRRIFDIDTTNKTIKQVVDRCFKIIKGKAKSDKVDFSGFLI